MLIAALTAVESAQSMPNGVCPTPYRRTGYNHSRMVAVAILRYPTIGEGSVSHHANTIDAVMADTIKMVCQVRHRIVDRTAEEILAVVEFSESHSSNLGAVAKSRFISRKSWLNQHSTSHYENSSHPHANF